MARHFSYMFRPLSVAMEDRRACLLLLLFLLYLNNTTAKFVSENQNCNQFSESILYSDVNYFEDAKFYKITRFRKLEKVVFVNESDFNYPSCELSPSQVNSPFLLTYIFTNYHKLVALWKFLIHGTEQTRKQLLTLLLKSGVNAINPGLTCCLCSKEGRKNQLVISCCDCKKYYHRTCLDVSYQHFKDFDAVAWKCDECTMEVQMECHISNLHRKRWITFKCKQCTKSYHKACITKIKHVPLIQDMTNWTCHTCQLSHQENTLQQTKKSIPTTISKKKTRPEYLEALKLATSTFEISCHQTKKTTFPFYSKKRVGMFSQFQRAGSPTQRNPLNWNCQDINLLDSTDQILLRGADEVTAYYCM